MKISNQQVIQDFRMILRYHKSLPTFKQPQMKNHILTQYRIGKHETNNHKIDALRTMANSYRKLVYDIKELKHLRYLDTGEKFDQRDKIRATAARVGLNVPRFSDENEDSLLRKENEDETKTSESK